MRQSPPRRWFRNLPPVRWVWGRLHDLGWPSYDCEDCIGMKNHGCQCAYYEAVAPCTDAGEFHIWVRWLHGFLFTTTSPLWTRMDNVRVVRSL